MMDKIISVSIAAYNVEKTLADAVESVLMVRQRELVEVIITNDGSTDDTLKTAISYQEKYPGNVTVINKMNEGYGSTIMAAVKVAKGKYFKVLDGDDHFETNEFEQLLGKLVDIDVDMIITPFEKIYANGRRIATEYKEIGELEGEILGRIENNIDMHAIVYKTSVLRECDLKLPFNCLYTDHLYCLFPMYCVSDAIYLSNNIYKYVIYGEGQSISRKMRVEHIEDASRVFDIALKYYKEHDYNGESRKMITRKMGAIYITYMDSLLLMPVSLKVLRRIKRIEEKTKAECPEIYRSWSIKKAKVFRKTNYLLYPLLALYYQYSYKG